MSVLVTRLRSIPMTRALVAKSARVEGAPPDAPPRALSRYASRQLVASVTSALATSSVTNWTRLAGVRQRMMRENTVTALDSMESSSDVSKPHSNSLARCTSGNDWGSSWNSQRKLASMVIDAH